MKKITIKVSSSLAQQIDESVEKWGFSTRTEFIRLACIDFLRNDNLVMPADETLDEYSKTIRSLRARRRQNKRELFRRRNHPLPAIDINPI